MLPECQVLHISFQNELNLAVVIVAGWAFCLSVLTVVLSWEYLPFSSGGDVPPTLPSMSWL